MLHLHCEPAGEELCGYTAGSGPLSCPVRSPPPLVLATLGIGAQQVQGGAASLQEPKSCGPEAS